ncbi:RICIN domain-containing protein [Paenibacillus rigui]|uniref:RICIN domain-containing protein n=1 Tax=Paenibacillus rigui TaxID=554312 RepID=UPI0015C68BD6|nr:RICIN domain-containing protein [Paenibacillus rigui]
MMHCYTKGYVMIGMSYYPYWDGVDYTQNIAAFSSNLNDMGSRYGKEVMVCEVGGLENDPTNTYNMLVAVQNAVKAVPNGKGLGVFYWEPEGNAAVLPDAYQLGATAVVSSNVLKFTDALHAFGTFPYASGTYELVNRNSGKALNVTGGASTDGANIEQWGYNAWSTQKWQFIDIGSGYYEIKNVGTGKALNVSGGSLTDGANIQQWTYNAWSSQKWQLITAGNGYYQLKNVGSCKLMDVSASSTADSAQIVQWASNGGWNQLWSIIKVN